MQSELVADRPGTSFSSAQGSGIRHGFEPRTLYHEQVAVQFARKIAHILDLAVLKNDLSDLVVVAEPHFLGLLNQEFSKRVKSVLKSEVPREWSQGSDKELKEYLREKLE